MMSSIRNFLTRNGKAPSASVPEGRRVYAVGDVHGRLDLFEALIAAIERDDAARGRAETTVVLLGDLVDRGPDSAGVIASARALAARRTVRILAGNHEDMFLECFDDLEPLRHFLRFGGAETIKSYLPDPSSLRSLTYPEVQQAIRRHVPQEDIEFLRGLERQVLIGDYLFVHAGIRPGVPLEEQTRQDLSWIREPFLSHRGSHGFVVVHGHTIVDEVQFLANRIGIDTGAFMSGRLTALGLEGTGRWIMEARDDVDAVSTSTMAA